MRKSLVKTIKKQSFGKDSSVYEHLYFYKLGRNYCDYLFTSTPYGKKLRVTRFTIGANVLLVRDSQVPLGFFGKVMLAGSGQLLEQYSPLVACIDKRCLGYALDLTWGSHRRTVGIVVVERESLFKVLTEVGVDHLFNIEDYPEYFVWGTSSCLRLPSSPKHDFWCGLYEPMTLNEYFKRYEIPYRQLINHSPNPLIDTISSCEALHPWTNQ